MPSTVLGTDNTILGPDPIVELGRHWNEEISGKGISVQCDARGGALMAGSYTVQSSGTLILTLGNTSSSEANSVGYSFSELMYVCKFNRKGLLVATMEAQAGAEEDDDGEPQDIQMDLIDVTDDLITKMGDTRLVIELPPRRRGEALRLEGKQILHFGERHSVQEWEVQLRAVLNKVRANRLMATQVP